MDDFESMDKAGLKQFNLSSSGHIVVRDWSKTNVWDAEAEDEVIRIAPEDEELIDALYDWCREVIESRKT